jgi:hypothetical protein
VFGGRGPLQKFQEVRYLIFLIYVALAWHILRACRTSLTGGFSRTLTLVCNTQNHLVSGLCPSSGVLNSTAFRKLNLFPSSGEGTEKPTLLGPSERANLSHNPVILPLKNETDSVSETFFLVI